MFLKTLKVVILKKEDILIHHIYFLVLYKLLINYNYNFFASSNLLDLYWCFSFYYTLYATYMQILILLCKYYYHICTHDETS